MMKTTEDKVKIEVYVRTNREGSDCEDTSEIDRDEWEVMSEEEKESICMDAAFNYIEWGWKEV